VGVYVGCETPPRRGSRCIIHMPGRLSWIAENTVPSKHSTSIACLGTENDGRDDSATDCQGLRPASTARAFRSPCNDSWQRQDTDDPPILVPACGSCLCSHLHTTHFEVHLRFLMFEATPKTQYRREALALELSRLLPTRFRIEKHALLDDALIITDSTKTTYGLQP
jgi:hypothetical protein